MGNSYNQKTGPPSRYGRRVVCITACFHILHRISFREHFSFHSFHRHRKRMPRLICLIRKSHNYYKTALSEHWQHHRTGIFSIPWMHRNYYRTCRFRQACHKSGRLWSYFLSYHSIQWLRHLLPRYFVSWPPPLP